MNRLKMNTAAILPPEMTCIKPELYPRAGRMSPPHEAPARFKSSIPEYCSNTTMAKIARIWALHSFETSDRRFTVQLCRTFALSSGMGM